MHPPEIQRQFISSPCPCKNTSFSLDPEETTELTELHKSLIRLAERMNQHDRCIGAEPFCLDNG